MLLAVSLLCLAVAVPGVGLAQDILPRPEPSFKGVIGQTYKDSTPDKIALTKAPAGAPNVLIVLIDDSGFGQWSTFGGLIPTPNLDQLAASGLRYTRFHTTALCSPTRAALLTGRNHHSAGHRHHHRVGQRLSGLQRSDSRERGHGLRDSPSERVQHGLYRQKS